MRDNNENVGKIIALKSPTAEPKGRVQFGIYGRIRKTRDLCTRS